MSGAARERQLRDRLRAEGWFVVRPGASLGEADLVALRDGRTPRLIQVKGNAGSPYMNFRPEERAALIAAAKQAGAVAELVHWPPRQNPRFIPSEGWP